MTKRKEKEQRVGGEEFTPKKLSRVILTPLSRAKIVTPWPRLASARNFCSALARPFCQQSSTICRSAVGKISSLFQNGSPFFCCCCSSGEDGDAGKEPEE